MASKPHGTLYVGMTSELVARVYQHREGFVEGFTKRYNIKRLVWFEEHATALAAIAREKIHQALVARGQIRRDRGAQSALA